MLPSISDPEFDLLGNDTVVDDFGVSETDQGLKNAPIFTGDAFEAAGALVFPQRALYGRIMAQRAPGFPTMVNLPKLYINTNAPFSGIVCGVQVGFVPNINVLCFSSSIFHSYGKGSGKSHSTSVLLESCLIRDRRLGTLPVPLSALLSVSIRHRFD